MPRLKKAETFEEKLYRKVRIRILAYWRLWFWLGLSLS